MYMDVIKQQSQSVEVAVVCSICDGSSLPDSLWNDSDPFAIQQPSEDECIDCSIQFRQRKKNYRLKTLHPSLHERVNECMYVCIYNSKCVYNQTQKYYGTCFQDKVSWIKSGAATIQGTFFAVKISRETSIWRPTKCIIRKHECIIEQSKEFQTSKNQKTFKTKVFRISQKKFFFLPPLTIFDLHF